MTDLKTLRARCTGSLVAAVLLLVMAGPFAAPQQAFAQAQSAGTPADAIATRRVLLRFMTTSDFPPFNFYDEDGVLTGFNVDLARAICLELDVTCQVVDRPWTELLPALARGEADAVIAGHTVTAKALESAGFSERYFHTPGRFAGRRNATNLVATPEGLEGKRIAVASGTSHEAFLRQYFRGSRILVFDNPDIAREALKAGEVDTVFGDAISLSFWINGTISEQCCDFKGGSFLEPKFFGDGLAIAITRGDKQLKADIDGAIQDVRSSGRFSELVSRYFPFQLY
ncbi:MAG: transporter substrate-binding domain-containing protein [Filomicrobium sp.]